MYQLQIVKSFLRLGTRPSNFCDLKARSLHCEKPLLESDWMLQKHKLEGLA
jgi:hypothetical protein